MRTWALVVVSVLAAALAGVVALAQSPGDSTDTTFCGRFVVPAEGAQAWYYIDDLTGVKHDNDGQYYEYADLPSDAEQIWRTGSVETDCYTDRTGPGEPTSTPRDGYRVSSSATVPTPTPSPTPTPTPIHEVSQ